MNAVPAQPVKKAPEDCLVRDTFFPLSDFKLAEFLSGEMLSFVSGKELPDCEREDVLFLDTETTGLSRGAGTVAFLTGVGFFTDQGLTVRQYLMRDYDEEAFLLHHVAQDIKRSQILCTFNGATFDLPLLEARFTMQRMRELYLDKPHLDLLPAARRVWKLRLGRCNLSALEAAVLGMEREDDLPGALVPQRYFDYLKSGDASLLEDVLRHNVQDIASLALILHRLLTLHESPLQADAPEDLFCLGKVCEQRGHIEKARQCYRAADQGSLSALCRMRIAETYRRAGEREQAAKIYQTMAACRQGGMEPLIALAKYYEHQKKDYQKALQYTRRAIVWAADQPGLDMKPLQKRLERLTLKLRRESCELRGYVEDPEGGRPASEGQAGGSQDGI